MNYLSQPPAKQSFDEDEGHPAAYEQWLSDFRRLFNTSQQTGTTAQRPLAAPWVGFPFFDTTLGKPVWAVAQSPAAWVDSTGAPV